ncbi:MAG: 4-carboxy-4-hydroxy-2-oxoadipate aldolase/oxaloacetate decarboxylase [Betaproteobacteria bacterium]|nr:MAG: 4-carboxy-4-hydroxy-2-oxoadipate aldolase/oxaloacetate decarboxylase [Betaproteobacteria bacterium]
MNQSEMGIVYTDVPRANAQSIKALGHFGVATIHEAMSRTGLAQPTLKPIYPNAKLCGNAVTVLAQPGDNWMLHVAVEQIQPGDVLVVACTTDNRDGMFGDLLATSLRARGAAGLVIDAGVRDVSFLTEMQFPVFAKAINARGTVKATLGSVNVPVVCAGALVHPGDVVCADVDGVVIVPRRRIDAVVAACELREAAELGKRARLAAGELGLDIYNMRPTLKAAGLRYIKHGDNDGH